LPEIWNPVFDMNTILKIKVIAYKGQVPEHPLSVFFDENGGTIGKKPGNHLVLPDPKNIISRSHATVGFDGNEYTITDTSANGTYMCNKDVLLKQSSVTLSDGDIFRIGDYTLKACMVSRHDTANPAAADLDSGSDLKDYFSSLGTDNGKISNVSIEPEDIKSGLPIDQYFVPPKRNSNPPGIEKIPTSFNFQDLFRETDPENDTSPESELSCEDIISKIAPRKDLKEAIPIDKGNAKKKLPDRELADIFLKSAGLKDPKFYDDKEITHIFANAGAVFGKLVECFMNILQARAKQKREIRTDVTMIHKTGNNPFKHSPVPDDVIKQLITNMHPGFLNGVDAVEEGYTDIMGHQLATAAGLQFSLMKLLQRFDPQCFENRYKEGIVLNRKAKCWDAYTQSYPDIVKEIVDNIYGKEFLEAYEKQLQIIKSEGHLKK
jgi:type VI secretion system protein